MVNSPSMDYRSSILHLYRSLLRSTSYLPDSLARLRVHNEIVHKFRKHHRSRRHAVPEISSKTLSLLRKQALKVERAADGNVDELKEILMFTYGRRGTRRRLLLSTLLNSPTNDVLASSTALDAYIKDFNHTATRSGYGSNQKLMTLLKSQKASMDSANIKELSPKVPELNIWMRKTPVKVRANMEKRWWARTIDKVQAPVEEAEWERLRQLANGSVEEIIPSRRKRPETSDVSARPSSTLLETWKGRVRGGNSKDKQVSSRGLKRLYGFIWSQTPVMAFDNDSRQWTVRWGKENTLFKTGVEAVPAPTHSELELFEGTQELPAKAKIKKGKRLRKIKFEEPIEVSQNKDISGALSV